MLSLIPVAVAFCAFLSSIKFMCTVLLPFYGTMPPRDPSSLRTFIVADALSIENLAHCGLTLFLSTLWWLTGVEFFGFFLLVTSTMLTAAAIGELYVVVAMTFHHTTNRYSSEAFGPIVLSSIFFIACFCVLVATCTSKIGGRKRLSLFNIPTAQINRSGLRTIFHVGLLLDVLCSACIFLVEAFGKNHQVIFSTFLPSFTKSFTVSMHHAAICTAGFVALRNLDNFLEVHIMVSIIFSPFLLVRGITSLSSIDQALSLTHGMFKLCIIGVGICLRVKQPRHITSNIKFDLDSFSNVKPTLFSIACSRRSLPKSTRVLSIITSVGVILFNICVPLEAICLTLNEQQRVGPIFNRLTLHMINTSINFAIHGAIAVPFLLAVFQNVWFYTKFRMIFALGGMLGCVMSLFETFRFGWIENKVSTDVVSQIVLGCIFFRGVGMAMTGLGMALIDGPMLQESMNIVRGCVEQEYESVQRVELCIAEAPLCMAEETKILESQQRQSQQQPHAEQDQKQEQEEQEAEEEQEENKDYRSSDNIVVVGIESDGKKEATRWLSAGNFSLIIYAISFGILLITMQIKGSQIRQTSVDTASLITGELLGFDVAWHILFFGNLLSWHGIMSRNLLTLGISTGIVASTSVSCGVAGWMLTGSEEMASVRGCLWLCCAASMYLEVNNVIVLKRMFD